MSSVQRDQLWLEDCLQRVWQRGFSDLEAVNRVEIRYGQAARTRLGSIRMSRDKKVSTILVNRLFRLEEVPMEVIEVTIAHELTHYVHGFSSPLTQRFKTPHAGGVVTKELVKRGFGDALTFQKRWVKAEWLMLIRQHTSPQRRHRRIRRPQRGLVRTLKRLLS